MTPPMETCDFPTGSGSRLPRVVRSLFPLLTFFLAAWCVAALVPRTLLAEEALAAAAAAPASPEEASARTSSPRELSALFAPCYAGPDSSSRTFAFAAARPEDGPEAEQCFTYVAAEGEPAPEPFALQPVIAQTPRLPQRFQWNSALKQSFRFMLIQHGARIALDRDARWMLLHKPFWHDYFASFKASEWGAQWGDGDSFLVNYVGHPLQGAITSNIYVQNDPSARGLKFENSRRYWNSRLKAMGWSAAYSMLFESGPVLSETAIGSAGGFLYTPGCGYYPTCTKEPGRRYKAPTNNTGWVDRVVTPTVGMGWQVVEDFLEAKLVDRFAENHSGKKVKILRAALAPSRSVANIVAGHLPWFRYPSDGSVPSAIAKAILEADGKFPDWRQEPRLAVGFHFAELNLPLDREGCTRCRRYNPGVGFDFEYRLARLWYFDSEYALFPGSGDEGENGRAHEMLFGVKFGRRFGQWGLFTQARPGLIHYEKSLVPGTKDTYDSVTRFAFDVGGTAEYHASPRGILRFRMGSTFVRYLKDQPDPNQPPVSVLSTGVINTQGNFYATSGYLFRF